MRILAVMENTFKETIRNRILLNILVFAIGLILLSLVIGDWSLGEQSKVIKDFGLSAMSIFGLLIAVFIGIRLMVQELEGRTIYIIASKPVHRWEIVTGKYLGLALTLAVNVLLMTAALLAAGWLMEGTIDTALLPAVLLIYIEILLIVAFSLFFSSFSSPVLSAIFTLTVFISGHLSGYLHDFVKLYEDRGFHWLLKLIYYVVPNLEKLNIKLAVVEHLKTGPHAVVLGAVYGLSYVLLLLIFTSLIFEKKDLK
ncbi:ABC transporter permease [bacterium]|nr:ABC transporter permease [bacterium]